MSNEITAPITIVRNVINAPISFGVTGKSAYRSYLDTTTDDPVLTEAEWSASGGGGGEGGSTTFAGLTDKATANLPVINTPLATALSGKQPLAAVLTATTASFTTAQETKLAGIEAGATGDQDLSGYLTISTAASTYQPLSATLTGTTASFTTALASKLDGIEAGATADQDLSGYVPTSRTIAGRALSSNITLVSADISDAATSGTPGALVKYDENGNIGVEEILGGGANFLTYIGTDNVSTYTWTLTASGLLTAARTYSPPNASGTLALTASTTGVPDAMHNATISGTVTFSGTGQASMFAALGTGTPSSTTYLRGDGTWATVSGGGSPGGSSGDVQYNNAGAFGAVSGFTLLSGALQAATITNNFASTTPNDALSILNTTAATSGNQRSSPRMILGGKGWGTTLGTSQDVQFGAYVLPTQGAAPTGTLVIQSKIAGGSWTDRVIFGSNGSITSSGIATGNSSMTNTGIVLGLASGSLNIYTAYLTAGGSFLAPILRQGVADAPSPVPQTFAVQSVSAGTSNTAGANRTFSGSQGTGTGVGGDQIFTVATAGSTGTAQNPLVEALRIKQDRSVCIANVSSAPSAPASGGILYVEAGALKYIGSSGTVTTLGAA